MRPLQEGSREQRGRSAASARERQTTGLRNETSPPALRVEAWNTITGLVHGFYGRHGGFSRGDFASLNLSAQVGDQTETLTLNWNRIRLAYAGLAIVRMQQAHGSRVVRVLDCKQEIGYADAMTTDVSGLALAVLTADCVPILMVAPSKQVVVTVHAGWRGTLAGIAYDAVVHAGEVFGVRSGDWQVALGPAIGACCYEVGAEIGHQLESRWGSMPEAWHGGTIRGRLDLRRANRRILTAAGLAAAQLIDVGPCTACAHEDFFSHRRFGGRTGRQLSLIGWHSRTATGDGFGRPVNQRAHGH